ncbi:MAG: FtsX-like permease family protein, partial [Chloroflexi bacterium]|nr:FtsX-like permease family protein [Chloroflexota bacterium]
MNTDSQKRPLRTTRGLAWRNITAHPLRSLLTTLAIMLGVAMVLAAAIVGQAAESLASDLSSERGRVDLQLFARDGGMFETAVLDITRTHPDVDTATPLLSLTSQATTPAIDDLNLLGVDPETYQALHQPQLAGGAFLDTPDTILLPVLMAVEHGLQVGDEVVVMANGRSRTLTLAGRLKIETGLENLSATKTAIVPLSIAQALAGTPNQIDQIDILISPTAHNETVRDALKVNLDSQLTVVQANQGGGSSYVSFVIQLGLGMVGIIILFAATFVIMNAFTMSITARTQEIGALRAVGMTRRQVRRQIFAEANLLGFTGVILGVPTGIGLAWLVMILRRTLDGDIVVPSWGILISVLLGLGTTWFGAWQPALRASQVSPLVAMQSQSQSPGEEGNWYLQYGTRLGTAVLLLSVVGVTTVALIWQPGFFSSWLLIGAGIIGLLVGAMLIMPGLVNKTTSFMRPLLTQQFGTAGRLAADNLGRNRIRTIFTAAALTIGLTMIIGTSGLLTASLKGGLSSFFNLFNEDAMIIPDIPALMASGELKIENSMDRLSTGAALAPELVTAVTNLPSIETFRYGFAPIPEKLHTIPGVPGAFVDIEPFLTNGNFDFFEGNAESALALMQADHGILLIPITAERLGVQVGDTIPIETSQGEVLFTLAGIGGNSTNFSVFSYKDGEEFFGVDGPGWLSITVDPNVNVDDTLADVKEIINAHDDQVAIFDMRESGVGGMLDLAGQIQVLLNALLLIAVIVAALGVVNTIVINVSERGREIGLLRAVGATKRQIRHSVSIEATTLGLFSAILASILGLFMLLVFVIVMTPGGLGSMGLRFDMELIVTVLNPALRDWGIATIFALIFGPLVAFAAAYAPAKLAAATNIIDATRSERISMKPSSDERPEGHHHHKRIRSHVWSLAWRNLQDGRSRTISSIIAVALGSAMIVAGQVVGDGIRAGFQAGNSLTDGTAWVVDFFELSLQIVGTVILVAAGFLIFNAFTMAITQRQQQIGVLRSLGMTRRQVMRIVLVEALILSVIGVATGLVLGPLVGNGLLSFMTSLDFEVEQATAAAGSLITAVFLGIGMTFISVWLPARRATRVAPLEAIRAASVQSVSKQRFFARAWIPGLLLIVGILGYAFIAPPGTWTLPPWSLRMPLLLGSGWLIGSLLILPALVGWIGRVLQRPLTRRWGANGRLVADNILRGRRRVTITILTFIVGLVMITSLTGILTFHNKVLFSYLAGDVLTNDGWELYPFDQTKGAQAANELNLDTLGFKADVVADVNALADGRAYVGENYMVLAPEIGSMIPQFPSMILDLQALQNADYSFVKGDWESALPIMEAGCGLFIPPTVSARHDVTIGDTITLQAIAYPIDCTVAAIGGGGVYPSSYISPAAKDAFGVKRPSTLALFPFPDTDYAQFEIELQALADQHGNDAFLIPPDAALAALDQSSDMLINTLNAMLLLAVLAAAMGVINTTMMSVTERRRELGLLRAVGATRRQVTAVITGEAALMGLIGGLIGLFTGVGLTIIFALSMGGQLYGIVDLPLYRAAWQGAQPAVITGILGLILAPLISMGAAWFPARSIVRGTAVDTLHPDRQLDGGKRPSHKQPARHLYTLAWRNLNEHRLRSVLSGIAVSFGVAMVIAADMVSASLLSALTESDVEGLEITHGFISEQFEVFLALIGYVLIGAAGFLVFNAFAMTITQRQRHIGALRAIGMTRKQVMNLVMVEALMLSVSGTLVGLLLGPGFGQGVILLLRAAAGELFTFGEAQVSGTAVFTAIILGISITLLSVLVPARRATRISPLEALRPQSAATTGKKRPLFTIVGIVLMIALAIFLIVAPPADWVDTPWNLVLTILFILLWIGAWLLLLPALIAGGSRLARVMFRRGANGRLIGDNIQRGQGRVSLTIITLALSLLMIVSMTGFIKFTFDELFGPALNGLAERGTWAAFPFDLEGGILAITSVDSILMPEDVIDEIKETIGDRVVYANFFFVSVPELSFLGDGYFTYVLDPETVKNEPSYFRFQEGNWDEAMPIMLSECGMLIPPTVAQRNGVELYESMMITTPGGERPCTVAGIGSPFMNASIINDNMQDEFELTTPLGLAMTPKDGVDLDQLNADFAALDESLGTIWMTRLLDFVDIQMAAIDIFAATLNGMLLLTTLAAALGVVNTTVMSVNERRQELGILRTIGSTRRQVQTVVIGEAALMGVIGGVIGGLAGLGIVVILIVTYGGGSWGIQIVDVWAVVTRTLPSPLINGLVGLIAIPIISAIAAYWPTKAVVQGTPLQTLAPSTISRTRKKPLAILTMGSIRTRFVVGTAVLMLLILTGLVTVITTHARNKMGAQMEDALGTLVATNAGMVEMSLPEDATTLDLDLLQNNKMMGFDADMLLRFETLMDQISERGLSRMLITDQDGVVLISLDINEIGTLQDDPISFTSKETTRVTSERDDGKWQTNAAAPIRNGAEDVVGAVQLTLDAYEIDQFIIDLRNLLWGVGIAFVLLGVIISWVLGTPFVRLTNQLSNHATDVQQGQYRLIQRRGRRFPIALSLNMRLTIGMTLMVALMVGLMQLVTLPLERQQLERVLEDGLVAGMDWMGELVSANVAESGLSTLGNQQMLSMDDALELMVNFDPARMQTLLEEA